jgi:hypothetical protein
MSEIHISLTTRDLQLCIALLIQNMCIFSAEDIWGGRLLLSWSRAPVPEADGEAGHVQGPVILLLPPPGVAPEATGDVLAVAAIPP